VGGVPARLRVQTKRPVKKGSNGGKKREEPKTTPRGFGVVGRGPKKHKLKGQEAYEFCWKNLCPLLGGGGSPPPPLRAGGFVCVHGKKEKKMGGGHVRGGS